MAHAVDDVAAVRTQSLELAGATGLSDARTAFGQLSGPFLALVEAYGVPVGYDLSRFTCGMRGDLPGGGVWPQRGAEPRNPYFGTRMLACATRSAPGTAVPARTGDLVAPEASGATDHGDMDHGAGTTRGTTDEAPPHTRRVGTLRQRLRNRPP